MGEPTNAAPIVEEPEPPSEAAASPPQVYLTFLLISGRRRTMSFESETTVGRVKELVWNAWPTGTHHIIPDPAPRPNE